MRHYLTARGYGAIGGALLMLGLACFLLAGCAIPHTRVYLPDPALKSDTTLGYQTEQDRHDIRLVPCEPKQVPGRVYTEEAVPFGTIKHTEWDTCGYPFINHGWYPMGLPASKGEHGAWQSYQGVKAEGGKLKEFEQNGWSFSPMEFHPIEQNAVRWKSDLDPVCTKYNMAGC